MAIDTVGGIDWMSLSGGILAFIAIAACIILVAVVVWAYFTYKQEPQLELYCIDDYAKHEELAKLLCPKECLNRKIGLSGTSTHIKAELGTIKGLRVIGTLKGVDGKSDDINLCIYLPKGENEILYKLLGKKLGNVAFATRDTDGLVGDILLKGINIQEWGKYNYLVSETVKSKQITQLIDQKTLENRMRESLENLSKIVPYAIRADPRHHKKIEENATMSQSQAPPPQQAPPQ